MPRQERWDTKSKVKPQQGPKRGRSDWDDDDEEQFSRVDRSSRKGPGPRKFSLDFMSKLQKQTLVAVLLFLVVLSAKYGDDAASGLIFKTFQSALSSTNDYSVALNELTKGIMGGQDTVTVSRINVPAVMPLEGTVVNKFGRQLTNGRLSNNQGIDIAAPLGTEVLAPMAGTVSKVGSDATLGRYVQIDHGNGLISLLGNFAQIKVKAGQQVVKGEELGTLGFTSSVKRPWLHWEVRRNDQLVDPQSLDIQPDKKL